jgi:hypothetical protein
MLQFQLERGDNMTKHCRKISGGHKLILTLWEGNMTRRGDVTTSIEGEAVPGREKGGDDVSWADENFTGPKNEEKLYG